MRKLLKRIYEKYKFDQKKEWDKIAYSFSKNRDFILDVGCGEGRFISLDSHNIIGLDWNTKSIKKCKNHNYNVIKCDVLSLPIQKKSISNIHCSHNIEHFMPHDVHKILYDFDNLLKNDGILIIRSPLLWSHFYSDLTHIRPYNPDAIIHYLTTSKQRTLNQISNNFEVVYLKWRYAPLQVKNVYLNGFFNILNRWGFPWIKKNGYMLIMRKGHL
ncbi:class I SAM-dependent methyltransferase [Candidatus Pacearchaeota archaeon]|nr:class I SAM-dependent methyltransferase [Candidatus Pacearchaeota archaeon]